MASKAALEAKLEKLRQTRDDTIADIKEVAHELAYLEELERLEQEGPISEARRRALLATLATPTTLGPSGIDATVVGTPGA